MDTDYNKLLYEKMQAENEQEQRRQHERINL